MVDVWSIVFPSLVLVFLSCKASCLQQQRCSRHDDRRALAPPTSHRGRESTPHSLVGAGEVVIMFLPQTVMRMMGRRLALRKGLVISVAVLLVIGWTLLLLTNRHHENPTRSPTTSGQVRAIASVGVGKKPSSSQNLTSSHLQSKPSSLHPPHHQASNHSLDLHMCKFADITDITGVDINVCHTSSSSSPLSSSTSL